ncbi:hypothetical protein AMTRI_Chr03g46580 [Amborella trichopoda]
MRHGLALGQFLNQEEDWRRKRGSGSQLELLLHSSHAPSIVVVVMLLFFLWLPGIDSTYHHSLSPPPLPCLMLIFLGGGEQLQDADEVECLRFISQRSLI